jgi:hypothetical protein
MSDKRVRVLVLGGRLTPSLVAVLSDRPDAIEFIVSSDTPERYDQARSVLAEPLEKQLPGSPLPATHPFDWEACQDRCRLAAARHPAADITFDVTTAPKFMSFAVQAFAKCNGHKAIVVDTARAREVSLINQQSQPVALPQTVDDYLRLFSRESKPTFDVAKLSIGEGEAIQVAWELVQRGKVATRALNKFNRWNPGRHGAEIKPKDKDGATTDDQEFEVFRMLAQYGLITDLKRDTRGKITYRTSGNPIDTEFVKGTWLEVYVWDEARALRDKLTGDRLFSDWRMGFEIPHPGSEKREVDVGLLYQGQFIHCSCKARVLRASFNKANLDEMTGVSKLVGGDFATRVFVTNAFQPHSEDQWMFAKHAERQKAVLVTGDELTDVGEILRRQAVEPKYARI